MHICVFGAGSLGSLVGGLLATETEVTLVGREPHINVIQESGLQITGEHDRTVHPHATTTPPANADFALVIVKSFDTEAAGTALSSLSLEGVLSLQNGLGNESVLASLCSAPVLAGTCTYGARLSEPGVVECTGSGDIALGPATGGSSSLADRLGDLFSQSGLETTVASDMPRRLWTKLAVNAGINAPTALARVENGQLTAGDGRAVATAAARETAQVAREHEVSLTDEEASNRMLAVAETTAANTSSMYQDILAGNRTEIDAINGYVVEAANEPVPVNKTITQLVRTWERGKGLR